MKYLLILITLLLPGCLTQEQANEGTDHHHMVRNGQCRDFCDKYYPEASMWGITRHSHGLACFCSGPVAIKIK